MSEPSATIRNKFLSIKKDDANKNVALPNNVLGRKFFGDGVPFKGKLIGFEDLSVDGDEQVCFDSMSKLKVDVTTRGEHKQKIKINLTISGIKIIDDATKTDIASHAVERISYVVIDPRDIRAFGYIYHTADDRLQFWAIKTERTAVETVIVLKELCDLIFEQSQSLETVTPIDPTIDSCC